MKFKYLAPLFAAVLLASCSGGRDASHFDEEVYTPREARLFRILGKEGSQSTIIETLAPWQGADSAEATRLMVLRGGEDVPEGFEGQVVRPPVRRLAVMSASYVAMLDLIGAVDRVVAVSGIDFITNKYVCAGRDTIADIGYDNNMDYERLLGMRPDLVLLYGVNGANITEPKLRELGIPFAYMGEYMEESPLGKAEWVVPLGEMLDLRPRAEAEYARIDSTYRSLSQAARSATGRPLVMLNTPYRDQWIMPSTRSYMVRLISDAGGQYIYRGNDTDTSLPIDMEEAYLLADSADYWINVGRLASLDELKRQFPKFADVGPVRRGDVWNTTRRVTSGGGNEFWETGGVHPDLVLRDLVKIFHPELDADSSFKYYIKL